MPQTIDNLSATWNNSGTTFTALKFNITDTASASGSLLMDLQVGGSSRFRVSKTNVQVPSVVNSSLASVSAIGSTNSGFYTTDGADWGYTRLGAAMWQSGFEYFRLTANANFGWGTGVTSANDLILTRRGAANLRLGAADAAAPVAQTLSVQSGTAGASALSCSISGTTLTVGGAVTGTIAIGHAVTGTGVSAGTVITAGSGTTWTVNNSQTVSSTTMYFNSVGQNLTITGSQASGPSAGGSIVFQVAPAGSAGTTAQNALATALTINADRTLLINSAGTSASPSLYWNTNPGALTNWGFYSPASGVTSFTTANAEIVRFGGPLNGFVVYEAIGFGPTLNAPDVRLFRDAANTLALRNGANAQTFRVYSTYTDASNYERGALNAGADYIELAAETAGAGDDNLDVRLTPAGTGNVRFGTHSAVGAETVTGYIQIKDAGGTIRKLAVIS